MSHNGPPPRWRNCPRRGQPVAGKFLPMKTMLGPRYDDQVAEENRFHPSMLSNYLKSLKVKMGLLVDLTNTTRFYERGDIEKEGVKYVKLQCRGYEQICCHELKQTCRSSFASAMTHLDFSFVCLYGRHSSTLETFKAPNPSLNNTLNLKYEHLQQLCFISKNITLTNVSLRPVVEDLMFSSVRVHCTHGFNRTGFLICAYLVEKMDWSIEAAVAAFSQARAPGIYKGDYLKELFRRYGDEEDAPPAPELPEWCFDDGDDGEVDDDGNAVGQESGPSSSGSAAGKRKKEKLKLGAVFLEGITVKGVTQITTQPKLGEIQRKCQEMAEWDKSGFPGAQPVSMDRQNLRFLEQKPYKVSWKADGTRLNFKALKCKAGVIIKKTNDYLDIQYEIEFLVIEKAANPGSIRTRNASENLTNTSNHFKEHFINRGHMHQKQQHFTSSHDRIINATVQDCLPLDTHYVEYLTKVLQKGRDKSSLAVACTQGISLLKTRPASRFNTLTKTSGCLRRYMMLINGKNEVFMVDRDNSIFHIANLEFPFRKDPRVHLANTLLDGEMIIDKVNGQPVPRYLIYDIIKFNTHSREDRAVQLCVLGALELSDTSNTPLKRERGGGKRKDFKERGATDEHRGLGVERVWEGPRRGEDASSYMMQSH
ncbi:mRNA-capping enzyme [Collichthys lucidus]|uniref:mRNA-capping enzyme n=1 Tax=Collichthys lucidus TaxID=240159 RepID=A0A4U5UMC6_COLLU|nr:mRNA-capping enzyme [Collichthys lucidus]